MKSSAPYLIKAKNISPYFSLMFGIVHSDLKAVEDAVKQGADVKKLFLSNESLLNDDDYDRDYDDEDRSSKLQFVLIPALDYAKEYSKTYIYENLVLLGKPSSEEKATIVIKKIMSCKQPEQLEELKTAIDKFVDSKNIDTLWAVKGISHPFHKRSWQDHDIYQANFLHFACYHKNEQALQLLLDLGANPNIKTKKSGMTPAHLAISQTPHKGDQSRGIRVVKTLLNYKANFDLKDTEKESVWNYAVSKFKIPELKIIFANHQPESLSEIDSIKKKSPRLYEFWQSKSKGFNKYPLINDIYKFENLNISFKGGISSVNKCEEFFKNKSLKTALDKRYGFSSKRFSSIMSKSLFERKDTVVAIDANILQAADFLKVIYLDQPTANFSDFLDVLETESSTLYSLADASSSNSWRAKSPTEITTFLRAHFTEPQIKTLLSYTYQSGEYDCEVSDTMDMIAEFPKEFSAILKRTPFSKIDNLVKFHDFISGESNVLSQDNFKLEQVACYPQLNKVPSIKLPDQYGIKIAEENHELIRWGAEMGHCIGGGSYSKKAKIGDCILLAITHNNEPKYAIEIDSKGNLQQVQGKSHSKPTPEVLSSFIKGMKTIGVLNKKQTVKDWEE